MGGERREIPRERRGQERRRIQREIRSTGAVVPGTHRSSGTVTPRSVEKRRLRGGSSGFEDTVGDEPPGRGRLGREQPG